MYTSLQRLSETQPVYLGSLHHSQDINAILLKQYLQHHDEPQTRKTHHFMGRFENTYLTMQQVPALQTIADMANSYAYSITGQPPSQMRSGFWFNEMHPGQRTSLHTHEEIDELLSAVYYISTPKDCGDLVVMLDDDEMRIKPVAGSIVLFSPDIPHSVDENRSQSLRLSVAFNFGRKD